MTTATDNTQPNEHALISGTDLKHARGKPRTTKSLITTKPVTTIEACAAQVSMVSGVLFAVLLGMLHVLEPEFDPTWRFMSEYMLGSVGWMMHFAFLALATSMASTVVAIRSQVRTWPGYIGLVALGIAAIRMLIAAIFPTDPATASRSPEAATFNGTIHVFGASLDFTPIAALLLSWSLARNAAWRPIRTQLFVTAAITFVVMVAFMAVLPYDGRIGPGVLAGLVGRFLLLSYLGWIIPVGLHVLKLHKQHT